MSGANAIRTKFLKAIFPDGLGFAHLLSVSPDKQVHDARIKVTAQSALEKFIADRPGFNHFVGIAPRRAADDGRLQNCATLAVLFAEIDFKDFSGGESEARARLATFPLPPSIVVASGGGLHVYWLLNERLDLSTDAAMTTRRLRALARAVGADLSAAEPARVLRLPGTENFKYAPARPVVLETFETNRVYGIDDLDAVIPLADEHEINALQPRDRTPVEHGFSLHDRTKMARVWLTSQAAAVQGKRGDSQTYQVCCGVVIGHDMPTDSAVEVLADWNARCSPPWPEELLRQKINNALRYGNGRPGELLVSPNFVRYTSGPRAGEIIPDNQHNIRVALEKMGFAFRFNAFAGVTLVSLNAGNDFVEQPLDDAGLQGAWLLADRCFEFRPSLEFFDIVVKDLARRNIFHPVKDYLDGLSWDGQPRIDTWLCRYGGAHDTAYTQAVASKILIAAVRRVRVPGAKFDELPICETPTQGTNKSSALAALCTCTEWFGDDLPLGVDSKQIIERTNGKWILEAGELHGYSNAQVEKLKGMLSRQVDGPVRLAYGRNSVERPRQFVMIGTTNEVTDYLRDTTGNRRFWPVRVERFDVQAIKRDRDQLWAEAAQREAAGESIRLPEELWAVAAVEQEARRSIDPWEEFLDGRIDFTSDVVLVDELWIALGEAGSQRKRNDGERLSKIMQRHGFTRKKKLGVINVRQGLECRGGKAQRRWAWIKDGKDPVEVLRDGGTF